LEIARKHWPINERPEGGYGSLSIGTQSSQYQARFQPFEPVVFDVVAVTRPLV
jgi:hypothetical protein